MIFPVFVYTFFACSGLPLDRAVHLIRRQYVREALSQCGPRRVAKVAVIGVSILVGKVIPANDLCRAAGQQGSDDRITVRVIVAHDFWRCSPDSGFDRILAEDSAAMQQTIDNRER